MTRLTAAFLLAGLALIAAGCGGGTKTTGTDGTTAATANGTARETIRTAAERFRTAADSGSCAALFTPDLRPSTARVKASCQALPKFKGFQIKASAQYGSGAAVDFVAAGRPGEVLFVLDTDGRWKWFRVLSLTRNTFGVGVQPHPRNDADANASAAVDAIRAGDCKTLLPTLYHGPAAGAAPKCLGIGKRFQHELAKNASAKPERLGGNGRVLFYAVRIGPRVYYTVAERREPTGEFKFAGDWPS